MDEVGIGGRCESISWDGSQISKPWIWTLSIFIFKKSGCFDQSIVHCCAFKTQAKLIYIIHANIPWKYGLLSLFHGQECWDFFLVFGDNFSVYLPRCFPEYALNWTHAVVLHAFGLICNRRSKCTEHGNWEWLARWRQDNSTECGFV